MVYLKAIMHHYHDLCRHRCRRRRRRPLKALLVYLKSSNSFIIVVVLPQGPSSSPLRTENSSGNSALRSVHHHHHHYRQLKVLLVYLKACLRESFRLHYPVFGGSGRVMPEDTVFSGYRVPKGV